MIGLQLESDSVFRQNNTAGKSKENETQLRIFEQIDVRVLGDEKRATPHLKWHQKHDMIFKQ